MVDSRASDYLNFLSERNRVRKLQNAKSPAEILAQQRERAFSTHFGGANASALSKKAGGGQYVSSSSKTNPSPSRKQAQGTLSNLIESDIKKENRGWGRLNRYDSAIANHVESDEIGEGSGGGDYYLNRMEDSLEVGSQRESSDHMTIKERGEGGGAAFVEAVVRRSLSTSPRQSLELKVPDGQLGSQDSHDNFSKERENAKGIEDDNTISSILGQVAALRESQQVKLRSLLGMDAALPSSPPTASATGMDGTVNPFKGLSIKIRLLGTWSSGKRASLRSIRLQYACAHDTNVTDVNISKFFDLRVFQGFQQELPPSSETVRNLKSLLMSDARLNRRCDPQWTCIASNSSPLDIVMEGKASLEESGESAVYHGYGSANALMESVNGIDFQTLLNSLNILLCNAKDETIAVRDLEVYVGTKCVCVSQLPSGAESTSSSVSINLVDNSVSLHTREVSKGCDRNEVGASVQVTKEPEGGERVASSFDGGADLPPPEWMASLKPAVRPGSARYSEFNLHDQVDAVSKSAQAVEASPSSMASPPGNSASDKTPSEGPTSQTRRKRNARMSRHSEKDNEGGSSDATLDRVLRRERVSEKEESVMRQSMDAISFADRFSQGRLSRTPLDIDSSIGIQATMTTHFTPPSANDGIHMSPIEGEDRLKRSQRIEDVQDKVATALSGLANIMQDLSAKKVSSKSLLSPGKMMPQEEQVSHGNSTPAHDASSSSSPVITHSLSSSVTQIPTLPEGTRFRLEVLSTWGDAHYVGLNGIDIFDEQGLRIATEVVSAGSVSKSERDCFSRKINISKVTGDPEDINVLPEYQNDPRHVSNLVDGVSFTRDDLHVWLAPVVTQKEKNKGPLARVEVEFSTATSLSMIRLWNYNKSRTYVQRGIRFCQLFFDDVLIFSGEIRIGPGSLSSAEAASEVILFTTDNIVLQRIAKHDEAMGYFLEDSTDRWVKKLQEKRDMKNCRPSTAERAPEQSTLARPPTQATLLKASASPSRIEALGKEDSPYASPPSAVPIPEEPEGNIMTVKGEQNAEDDFMRELRALDTSHIGLGASPTRAGKKKSSPTAPSPYRLPTSLTPERLKKLQANQRLQIAAKFRFVETSLHHAYLCSGIRLMLHSTHGDMDYIGLGGAVFYIEGGQALDLSSSQVTADPRDMSVVGHFGDVRTPDKLLNGRNNTTVDSNMWIIPYTSGGRQSVTFSFGREVALVALQVWNFNKVTGDVEKNTIASDEMLLRGANLATLEVLVGSSMQKLGSALLRRAPGCDLVPFPQTLFLDDIGKGFWSPSPRLKELTTTSYVSPRVNQDYETLTMPTGMLWKFTFYENHNDGFYIGLDGMEMFDENGAQVFPLEQRRGSVHAVPHSLIDIGQDDERVPESLFFPPSSSGQLKAPGEPQHKGWLAPLSRCLTAEERSNVFRRFSQQQQSSGLVYRDNVLFVLFDKPISLSLIRFYNYAKTPSRGVRSFGISLDGNDIYMGTLKSADSEKCVPNIGSASAPPSRLGQSVIFSSSDQRLIKSEKERVCYSGSSSQDVLCINERKVMVRSKTMYSNVSNAAAEGITSDLSKRPSTAKVPGNK